MTAYALLLFGDGSSWSHAGGVNAPNNAPTPAVRAMASAPQNITSHNGTPHG